MERNITIFITDGIDSEEYIFLKEIVLSFFIINYPKEQILGRTNGWFGFTYGVLCHFQQYFSYIMALSFTGGGNQSIRRKPPTCCK